VLRATILKLQSLLVAVRLYCLSSHLGVVLTGLSAAVNCVVQFADEDDADSALKGLFGRWYAGRPMVPEFSPVTGKGTCISYYLYVNYENNCRMHVYEYSLSQPEALAICVVVLSRLALSSNLESYIALLFAWS
jgi:hypothetical protein